jgi:hypothetical protein
VPAAGSSVTGTLVGSSVNAQSTQPQAGGFYPEQIPLRRLKPAQSAVVAVAEIDVAAEPATQVEAPTRALQDVAEINRLAAIQLQVQDLKLDLAARQAQLDQQLRLQQEEELAVLLLAAQHARKSRRLFFRH